jgi:hypothetical protein
VDKRWSVRPREISFARVKVTITVQQQNWRGTGKSQKDNKLVSLINLIEKELKNTTLDLNVN